MRIRRITYVLLAAAPALWTAWLFRQGRLGANPIEAITHASGDWALRCLLLSLSVTPLRRWSGWNWLAPLRRALGLTAFCYAALHLVTYLWLDRSFDWPGVWKDVRKRPFITAGAAAFLALLPLAATSTAGWIRRLGGTRWRALHRLAYLAAAAAALHYYWLVKSDVRVPAAYAAVLALLLALRLRWRAARTGIHLRRAPRLGPPPESTY